MTSLFGISNCNSVKKARSFLSEHGVDYTFIDLKKIQLSPEQVSQWLQIVGVQNLINRKGTSWRNLSEAEKLMADSTGDAVTLILHYPTLIKRPLIEWNNNDITVGFDETFFTEQIIKNS
ncbi:MAG: Spx/MgsR family RNA polymerase-binding regulatory protein [Neisseriaceae bacterium]|nr:Spx/MgsR family RNA polymerase-binding regulatory protein [Neisseriaceae bacterium]